MAWPTEGGVPAVTVYIVDMRSIMTDDGRRDRLCLIRQTLTGDGELVEERTVAQIDAGPDEALNLVSYVRAGGRLVAGPRIQR